MAKSSSRQQHRLEWLLVPCPWSNNAAEMELSCWAALEGLSLCNQRVAVDYIAYIGIGDGEWGIRAAPSTDRSSCSGGVQRQRLKLSRLTAKRNDLSRGSWGLCPQSPSDGFAAMDPLARRPSPLIDLPPLPSHPFPAHATPRMVKNNDTSATERVSSAASCFWLGRGCPPPLLLIRCLLHSVTSPRTSPQPCSGGRGRLGSCT